MSLSCLYSGHFNNTFLIGLFRTSSARCTTRFLTGDVEGDDGSGNGRDETRVGQAVLGEWNAAFPLISDCCGIRNCHWLVSGTGGSPS